MGDTITQEIIQVVEIADRGLTGPAGLPVDILAAAPASPTEGYTYYNTTDHKLWFWNGTAWVDVTDAETFDGQDSPYYLSRDNHTGPTNAKTTPVDADNAVLLDSAAAGIAKKLSWANIKATLKTYFDTLYQAVLVSGNNIKTINGSSVLGSGNLTVSGGGGSWGSITGTLGDQTDLETALDAKAPLASPTFTGTPAAPTAAPGTNTTQLASTAFVKAAVDAIPPGGVAIGDAVSGGTANAVLFVDASGNLGQDATNFKWNNGLTLIAPSVTNTPLTVKGTSGQSAPLQEWYNGSGVKTGDIQEDGQLALYAASSQINIQNTGGGQGGLIGRDVGSGGLAISANVGDILCQAGSSANTIKLISNNGIIEAYNNSGGAGILLTEMTAPAAPAANKGVLFLQDNGSGKTQFCVRFPTGAVQVIATEP